MSELFEHCRAGDLAGLQAYLQTCRPAVTAARAWREHAMSAACAKGHLEVAQWLQQTLRLTADCPRGSVRRALRVSCCNGHVRIAHWLCQVFGLTAKDIRSGSNTILHRTCIRGDCGIIDWMGAVGALTEEDVRADGFLVVRIASQHDRLPVLRWFQHAWGLPPAAQAAGCSVAPAGGACDAYLRGLRTLRWSPRTHADFPQVSRAAAHAALLVRERQARAAACPPAACPPAPPPLPVELWLHVLSHLPAW